MELTEDQSLVFEQIFEWARSTDTSIAILTGSAGTGKTTLLKAIVDKLDSMKKTATLLAPTGRAARILEKRTLRPATTIHSAIYELGDLEVESETNTSQLEIDTAGFSMPFKLKNGDAKANFFIIDESSMVSDKATDNDFLSFGSGRLLHDLLHYTNLLNKPKSQRTKILFVGDNAQLPPVKSSDSPALSRAYFLKEFKLNAKEFRLTKVIRQAAGSLILRNAEDVRKSIDNEHFENFQIKADEKTIYKINPTKAVNVILDNADNENNILITTMNSVALSYNSAIRNKKYGSKSMPVQKGDVLLVTKNTSKYSNGDILNVIDVGVNPEIRKVKIRDAKEPIELIFRDVVVRLIEEHDEKKNQQCKILENLLYKTDPMLSHKENQALLVDFRNRNKKLLIKSEEFKSTLVKDEYLNAVVVKFGYSITCHKAQGGEWDNVIVSFDRPRRDSDFFRWAYTAITRAKKNLYLISDPLFGVLESEMEAEVPLMEQIESKLDDKVFMEKLENLLKDTFKK
jgi:ATP-dependent exoDNAse (exonuclease V) alpha subunit